MEQSVELAVKRAIMMMQENLGEQLTVEDMARAAMFSKFHFSRIFLRATGVSPGRFLSALRLQRAKHLLRSTKLNVADISLRVGYNSLGTFSSRFTRSVGLSPTAYRRLAGFATHIPIDRSGRLGQPSAARVSGEIRLGPAVEPGLIFVGMFPDRIPEGRPVSCAVLTEPGCFHFESVPTGSWYLLAQSVTEKSQQMMWDHDAPDQRISVATHGPLTVRSDTVVEAELTLQPAGTLDPPVLLALLDVRPEAPTERGHTEPRPLLQTIGRRQFPWTRACRPAA
ncbi:helix-turn-helix domain-containing protein [Salinispora arenicola]|uniref:Transcriptional regulator, AraC family n=1 Tax=Salinispora arenicola (strain CNS-205) TaxID=391037 RepID=A8M119_SALAI|nr:AraC family transcriptional regulator [Salinispora arenicola]MCN0177289.1 AraC family transcriptional regulator [Salinispora arenicola]NIL55893.1 helix-turn-helix transcriptional regulator [Salinispora arenicola]NIL60579.1 helix-turn-helix transcriptional regulator [Salinispora arenicola]